MISVYEKWFLEVGTEQYAGDLHRFGELVKFGFEVDR